MLELSKRLHEQAAATDKTLKLYPNHAHVLLEEPAERRDVVLQDIIAWIQAHT